MPFHYRLQKVLEFRIRKKEEQLQEVLKAQNEVNRIEALIEQNNREIVATRQNMRSADPMMYEGYDKFLKHLYEKGEQLELMLQNALQILHQEKLELIEREKDVKILEKHKERMIDAYKAEEKALELKRLSEIGTQKHFRKDKEKKEDEADEEYLEMLKNTEGTQHDEY